MRELEARLAVDFTDEDVDAVGERLHKHFLSAATRSRALRGRPERTARLQ